MSENKSGQPIIPHSVKYDTEGARRAIEVQAKHIRDTEHAKGNTRYTYEQARRVAESDQHVIDKRYGK